MSLQLFQGLPHVLLMFLQSIRVYQDIIEVRGSKAVEERLQGIIDEVLEGHGGIGWAERLYQRFVEAIV